MSETIKLVERMRDKLGKTDPNNPIINKANEWLKENDFRINTSGVNKMLYVDGGKSSFHCNCGCNVFQNMITDSTKYVCNSCQTVYIGK